MNSIIKNATNLIKKHEGKRLYPYKCTANKMSIGFGRNLDDMGISDDEATYLLSNDIKRVVSELSNRAWFDGQNQARKVVLIDMCFNLGISRLLLFKRMISALKNKDYKIASKEMLNSRWANQVGNRATLLSDIMKRGTIN